MDITNKLWNFCHILRHDGMDYADYVEQLTYLLFLKMADEGSIEVPADCHWRDMLTLSGKALTDYYDTALNILRGEPGILGQIFQEPISKIKNAASLKKIVEGIEEIGWTKLGKDVQGEAFEGLLERTANEGKKGAGQFFTPRPLIQAIVNVMQPNPLEGRRSKIADVACGTAGFLTVAAEWSRLHSGAVKQADKDYIRRSAYYGQELVVRPFRLGLMSMFLHDIEANISLKDSIYDGDLLGEEYDCILTNPPFGSRGSIGIPKLRNFPVETSNIQINFIQHIYEVLSEHGRAAIVLPDSALTDAKAREVWQILITENLCRVHTILKLPRGTFTPYANGVRACVVFLQKGSGTKSLWVYDSRSNVPGITKKSRPLDYGQHFAAFVEAYGSDPNGKGKRTQSERFRKFTLADIAANNYSLDFSWIEDNSLINDGELQKPITYIEDTLSELDSLNSIIASIKDLLEGN
ncbi:class I SAM-dependent DNA methyltransferase [Hymenobacter swuensis]|uniref:site-specific DNA-methyltransferase (adenine-specific) n=1 Tax=Hymenobacter swuensis DY53 TaxID=1227739 RepID=W8F0B7_9BACT|nr:class I SAM-dependent DNA methyltransferase [Hymenobacter swuensis]AHJ95325.1 putative site-specific DNA-methyltransferase (adenine-specific) [Hymenobacter swuensis DY53]